MIWTSFSFFSCCRRRLGTRVGLLLDHMQISKWCVCVFCVFSSSSFTHCSNENENEFDWQLILKSNQIIIKTLFHNDHYGIIFPNNCLVLVHSFTHSFNHQSGLFFLTVFIIIIIIIQLVIIHRRKNNNDLNSIIICMFLRL